MGTGDGEREHDGWTRVDDLRLHLAERPATHPAHLEVVLVEVQGEVGRPRGALALVVAEGAGQATVAGGRRGQPGVPHRPGPHDDRPAASWPREAGRSRGFGGHRRSLPAVAPDPLPRTLVPMKATSGELPLGEAWGYEVKWDGMRALAFVERGSVRVQSYNERDVTASWPELTGLAAALPAATALLDGEIVATDDQGRPSFGRLQQRMHLTKASEVAARAAEVPVTYVVFDLLHLDGHDLTGRPLRDRRRLLDELLEPGPCWQRSPVHDDGQALLDAATAQGLEGVVAKRLDSPYEPGKRVRTWLKVKVRRQQEMVVGGWVPGEGNRSGRIGALLVGYHERAGDGGPLHFAGRVGTGFTDAELRRLEDLLDPLSTDDCPFDPLPPRIELRRGPRWVRPELVAELAFGEWTSDGRLRHPSYLGLRDDKAAADVTRDP